MTDLLWFFTLRKVYSVCVFVAHRNFGNNVIDGMKAINGKLVLANTFNLEIIKITSPPRHQH